MPPSSGEAGPSDLGRFDHGRYDYGRFDKGRFDRVMRWAQLTLVEDDPGRFDPKFWIDYFRRTRSQGACLSAGGCVAFYPTRIPLHHRSVYLGGADPFGELVAGCRELGMTVIARIDPHAIHADAASARPDWVAVGADGEKRRHWASPEMWVACTLGSYTFEFMTEVIREIMGLYRVDGIFANRWEGSGTCFCESCRKSYRDETGRDLAGESPEREYSRWKEETFFRLWERWDEEIRSINPGARFIPNTGGGAQASLDMVRAGDRAPFLVADRQARQGLAAPWFMAKYAKEYRAAAGTKPVAGLFNVGIEERYRWKDSVNSEAETRIWAAEAIANGMRPWFCKFAGALHDERWLKPVERIFRWHHSAERYLRNTEPLARVAMAFSQNTFRSLGPEQDGRRLEEFGLGMTQALLEARVPFEMIHDQKLDRDLNRYRLLILPNIAALSDMQCAQIRDFVRAGGGLLATFETSLYEQNGNRRPDFGLADLFGVSPEGELQGPMRNSYLKLHPDPDTGRHHRVLRDLENAGRIINGVWRIPVGTRRPFPHVPLTLVPPYPDLPMEKVYPRIGESGIPELYLSEYGAGRVAYVPWDIDRAFWEISSPDHGKLMRNLFEWAMGGVPQPVRVSGPGLLDISVWRQAESLTVHLVNLNNPRTMKGPYRELLPSGPQIVRLELPARTRVKRARLLRRRKTVRAARRGRTLSIRVPEVLDHEVVAVELS